MSAIKTSNPSIDIRILLVFLAALTLGVYSFALQGSFKTMDDRSLIVENENIRDITPANIKTVLTTSYFSGNSYYRPLVLLNHMFEYRVWKLNPVFYYLGNIFLHIGTSLVVFFIFNLLFSRKALAFFASLLFAIHPVHWEEVSNISGRSILLCAFFYLLAFLLYCRSEKRDQKACWSLSMACLALSLLSKESAVMFPFLIFVYQFLLGHQRRFKHKFREAFYSALPYTAIVFMYLSVREQLAMTNLFHWRNLNEAALGFLTFLRGVLTYLRLFAWPVDLYFDRSRPLFLNLLDWEIFLTLFFYLAVAAALFKYRKKIPVLAVFLVLWFCLELFPVSQVFVTIGVQPGYISLAEHFLYVPSAAVIGLMVIFVQWLYQRNLQNKIISAGIFQFGTAGIFAFFILLTVQQNIYSSNELSMFERSLNVQPYNTRVRNSLALAYAHYGIYDKAEEHFRRVLAVDPEYTKARIGLGKALCDQDKCWEGFQEYLKIKEAGNQAELLQDNIKATGRLLVSEYSKRLAQNPGDTAARQRIEFIQGALGQSN